MSIIVKASGPNDSDNSIERMQPSMLIEVVLSGGSIHASSSPEMEYFEEIQFDCYLLKSWKCVPDAIGIYCHHFDVMCAIVFLVFSCCLPML